jgi:UDP-4-amino-4,6-dideoxy-N-acetyl-beta-L-altrosamine transaminase
MSHKVIPYGKQFISEEDIQAVVEVLKSDYLTQGPKIEEFEQKFAQYIGVNYAVAVSNGTAALHLCALALEVSPGQKVITTPITFAASANCIRYCGGDVVFSDINSDTYLIDIDAVKKLLSDSPIGTYQGIIPVDFAGRAVNLEELRELANQYNLWIIEDACHAPGGYFIDSKNNIQHCGNGQFADLAIFSFHPVKHIAAGEGGMITTNDIELYKKLLKLRTHGITKNSGEFVNTLETAFGKSEIQKSEYPLWYMEMQDLGFNYRLTDFQAALGKSQLTKANERLQRRRDIAKMYADVFSSNKKIIRSSGDIEGHAYHLFVIEIENREDLYTFLRTKNIFAQVHYFPTHLMPYYAQFGWKSGDFIHAENYYSNCLSLPMYPTMTDEDVNYVINNVLSFLGE